MRASSRVTQLRISCGKTILRKSAAVFDWWMHPNVQEGYGRFANFLFLCAHRHFNVTADYSINNQTFSIMKIPRKKYDSIDIYIIEYYCRHSGFFFLIQIRVASLENHCQKRFILRFQSNMWLLKWDFIIVAKLLLHMI